MKRVLVVEDNILDQSILSSFIASHNMISTVVPNGFDALEEVGKVNFDLILIDVQMPFMNGLKLQKRLKAHCQSRHIPMVLMSGICADSGTVQSAIDNGAWDFFVKPIHCEVFDKKMIEIQRKRKELLSSSDLVFLESTSEYYQRECFVFDSSENSFLSFSSNPFSVGECISFQAFSFVFELPLKFSGIVSSCIQYKSIFCVEIKCLDSPNVFKKIANNIKNAQRLSVESFCENEINIIRKLMIKNP